MRAMVWCVVAFLMGEGVGTARYYHVTAGECSSRIRLLFAYARANTRL